MPLNRANILRVRFWITKDSELSVREQIIRQVRLAILSEDLPVGQKLPSVRAVARRHRIHANTVSSAYHDLLERGWVELRRGSGLYVRPLEPVGNSPQDLDGILKIALQAAARLGCEPAEVLERLRRIVRPTVYRRLLIADPEPALRRILAAEVCALVPIPVETMESSEVDYSGSLVLALATRARQAFVPDGAPCLTLHLRSVRESLEGQTRPAADAIVAVASQSAEIRFWAHAMMIAVGVAPECLVEVDSGTEGWQQRLSLSQLTITDVLTARYLPAGCNAKVFRIISDASMAELRRLTSQ